MYVTRSGSSPAFVTVTDGLKLFNLSCPFPSFFLFFFSVTVTWLQKGRNPLFMRLRAVTGCVTECVTGCNRSVKRQIIELKAARSLSSRPLTPPCTSPHGFGGCQSICPSPPCKTSFVQTGTAGSQEPAVFLCVFLTADHLKINV